MMICNTIKRRLAATIGATALLIILGCSSEDGLDKRYPLSGTVTYKGANVPSGTISFHSDNPAIHGAQSEIKDGHYSLGTLSPGDGVLPGKYKVTIESLDIDLTEVKNYVKSKGGNPEGQLPQEMVNKARAKAKSNAPKKYSSVNSTPLTAEVTSSSPSTLDFPLED